MLISCRGCQFNDALTQLHGASVTYRIATGPQQGRKVFTLQTLPAQEDKTDTNSRVANHTGFSLHAGVMAEAHQRDKLERLCRYISRPAVSEKRLVLTANGQIRYELKTHHPQKSASRRHIQHAMLWSGGFE